MKRTTRSGFTIIELLLSITFVSILLVTIALLISHTIATYQKGVALKTVNSIGLHIIDDISRTVNASPAKTAETICRDRYGGLNFGAATGETAKCVQDNAYRLTFYQKYGSIETDGGTISAPLYGVFCTGRYSYIWNSGYLINTGGHYRNPHNFQPVKLSGYNFGAGSSHPDKTIRLLKVPDPRRHICASQLVSGEYSYVSSLGADNVLSLKGESHFSTSEDIDSQNADHNANSAIELISETDESFAIYDLRIFKPAIHNLTKQSLYSGTFILASTRGSVDITGTGDYCQAPTDDFSTDFAYCAINKFNFAARALGQMRTDELLERNIYDNLK